MKVLSDVIRQRGKEICFYSLALFLIGFLVFGFLGESENVLFDNEDTMSFNEGWHYVNAQGGQEAVTLPAELPVASGERVILTRTIPDSIPGPIVLCFRSSHQSVRVTFDEEKIYDFGLEETRIYGKSPGSAWNLVRLPEGCAGGRVTIELNSPYEFFAGTVGEVRVGTKAALIFYLLGTYLPSLLISAFIFVIGFVLVILYNVLRRKTEKSKEMLYLGCFAMLSACWLLGESKMVQFFIGKQFWSMCMTFICLLLFPIPIFKFICCRENFRYKKLLEALISILYVQAAVACAFQCFHLYDFIEMMPFIQAVLLIVSLVAVVLVVIDWQHNRNRELKGIMISFILLCIFAFLEWISLNVWKNANTGAFIRVGVCLFIMIQAWIAVKKAANIVQLSRVASVDVLTGCQNRTAYIHALDEMQGQQDIMAALADLNDLKQINDTMGHQMGDDALIRCASCFSKAFSHYGTCYRIGGDEFLFMGNGLGGARFAVMQEEFEKLCQAEVQNAPYTFQVAIGGAVFDKTLDHCAEDTIRRADHQMYANKQLMKGRMHVQNTTGGR